MNEHKRHILRIAYDAKRAYLNYRGLGNYCRNLFAQMARYYSENEYWLCTPKDEGLFPWLNENPFERVMPSGLWSLSPSVWRMYGIPGALEGKGINIYHGLSQELPNGIERLGCKTIVTMHDAIFMRHPELYSAAYRRSFIRRNESACRRADLIIAISEQTKCDYMAFFGVEEQRIKVIYQGCNDIYWQPCSEEQILRIKQHYHLPSEYILSVGALEPRKNQLRLIKAIAIAETGLPLILIGRGNTTYKKELTKMAMQHNVQLHIIENATLEDLPILYHLASLFVYPSLFEGFGIPVLEAARCQTPIIASSGICFEEIVGNGALYASPTDIEEISDAIRRTLQDSALTSQRVTVALQNTEKFQSKTIAHNMMETYHQLCSV